MSNSLTLEEIESELRQHFADGDFDLGVAAVWMRYAYAHAYTSALEDPEQNLEEARKRERQAWAALP